MMMMAAPAADTTMRAAPAADTTMRKTLQDLGLHDIYATLAAEEIDDSVFCDLQDGDLKELSISRGNRRKIRTAIAARQARGAARAG